MTTIYIAQANIGMEKCEILKGESITKDVFDRLPERLKNKFKAGTGIEETKNRNEIIGDNDEEKIKREQLAKNVTGVKNGGRTALDNDHTTEGKIIVGRKRKGRL